MIEAALEAELSGHLGYPPGETPPQANRRNGGAPKTLKADLGPVEMRTPRDRDASCGPQLVKKRQTRLAGLDDRVLDMYAGGMSTRDSAGHLTSLYGVGVSADTISRVTDGVLEDIASWRSRPLDELYPIVYFDAMVRHEALLDRAGWETPPPGCHSSPVKLRAALDSGAAGSGGSSPDNDAACGNCRTVRARLARWIGVMQVNQ